MKDYHPRFLLFAAIYFVVIVVALWFAFDPTVQEFPRPLDKTDWIRLVGAFLGAFVSGLVAILLYRATVNRETDREKREVEQIKRSIWQDLRATLHVIDDHRQHWAASDWLQRMAPVVDYPVEELRPTVFDAVLDRIGELDEDQAYYLLLTHDNLRSAREQIAKYRYAPSGLSPVELTEHRENCKQLGEEIAKTLEFVCSDALAALGLLDPQHVLEKRHRLRLRKLYGNEYDDSVWLDDMKRRVQPQLTST